MNRSQRIFTQILRILLELALIAIALLLMHIADGNGQTAHCAKGCLIPPASIEKGQIAQPYCPTEDSCNISFQNGQWLVTPTIP